MATKQLLSKFAVGVALTCGSVAASAALLPLCVNDSSLGGIGASPGTATVCAGEGPNVGTTGFAVDLLTGSYVEKLRVDTLNPDGVSGTFSTTILFNISKYSYQSTPLATALGGFGAAANYDLYALVMATGTFSGVNFNAITASLGVYADDDQMSIKGFAGIDDTTLAYTGGGAGAADILLGSSNLLVSGSGTTGPSAGTDGFAVTFGDFTRTVAGSAFFIAPEPFYLGVYSDGDITDATFVPAVGGIPTRFGGEASANFVPEPGSLALVGMALVGLGVARRRRI